MDEERLGKVVLDSAFAVHTALGPGLLESVYERCLEYEIQKRGIAVQRQVTLPVKYDGVVIDNGYRLNRLVDTRIIVEVKSAKGSQVCTSHR